MSQVSTLSYVQPGQRWKLPSGRVIQVVSYGQEDAGVVNCAPVIGGVLCSDKHRLLLLAVRFIQTRNQIR
jgi:hypothetical protein